MKQMPIQHSHSLQYESLHIPEPVYMKAYEVYSEVYAPQQAMIEGGCRGGWGLTELVAFLYASGFPKSEWSKRVDEAFDGIKL